MRSYCRTVLSSVAVVPLVLYCGCAKKSTAPTAPMTLDIYVESSSRFDVQGVQIKQFFWNIGVTEVVILPEPNPHAAPNEFNIYDETWSGVSIEEIGTAGGGNDKIWVDAMKIDEYFAGENRTTKQKICALTFAHEIGHCFLKTLLDPLAHEEGSTDNVMTDAIANVLPRLRTCQYPEFNADQAATIRKKLGY